MTNEQVERQIKKDLAMIVLRVSEWAKDLLLEYIDEYVYRWGDSMKMKYFIQMGQTSEYWKGGTRGKPTGQLRRSITLERINADVEGLVAYMLFSDPAKMQFDPMTHLHGNSMGTDYRAVLLERLDEMKDDYIVRRPEEGEEDDDPDREPRIRWWKKDVAGYSPRYHFFERYLDELDKKIYLKFFDEMRKAGMKPQVYGISVTAAQKSTALHERRADTWDF